MEKNTPPTPEEILTPETYQDLLGMLSSQPETMDIDANSEISLIQRDHFGSTMLINYDSFVVSTDVSAPSSSQLLTGSEMTPVSSIAPAMDDWSIKNQDPNVIYSSPATGSIVSNTMFPGPYDFKLVHEFENKSIFFSESLNKLYLGMNQTAAFQFTTSKRPPSDTIIRAMPAFSSATHIKEVVMRCPNHYREAETTNFDFSYPQHLIRCENEGVFYHTDPFSKRLSVIAPFTAPPAGQNHSTFLYKIMCLGSCIGGINRRPIEMIFTLEHNNQIIGRHTINLRVSACPKRDYTHEEKQNNKNLALYVTSTINPQPKQDNDLKFTLEVKYYEDYLTLSKINESLELVRSMRSESGESLNRLLDKRRPDNRTYQKKPKLEEQSTGDMSGPGTSSGPGESISSWLRSLDLGDLIDLFRSHGFIYMSNILQLSSAQIATKLVKMGLEEAILNKLLSSILNLRAEFSKASSQSQQSWSSSSGSSNSSNEGKRRISKFSRFSMQMALNP